MTALPSGYRHGDSWEDVRSALRKSKRRKRPEYKALLSLVDICESKSVLTPDWCSYFLSKKHPSMHWVFPVDDTKTADCTVYVGASMDFVVLAVNKEDGRIVRREKLCQSQDGVVVAQTINAWVTMVTHAIEKMDAYVSKLSEWGLE